jgi:hypothetical protein
MSRLFGALANAAAKYGEGRFKRRAYDDQQAQIDLENKRRAFEFSATQGRLTEQMNLMKQQRDDALQRQREGDVVDAQQSGYETAAPEAIGAAANAYLQSQGMGGPGSAGVVRAPNTAPKKYELEGQTFGDDTQPGRQMQYATVGGRMMRYDPQRKINDETRKAFEGYTKELTMKRDVAQENQKQRDDAAKERGLAIEAMRAANRPQPQVPEDLFVDTEGNYNYVQRGRAVPRGWKPAAAGAAGNKPPTAGERQANALLEFGRQGAQGTADRYGSGFTPGTRDQIAEQLPPAIGNLLMSGEAQQLYADTEKLVMASQYLLSGKAVTKVEAKKIARGLVIQPGDSPETMAYKKGEVQKRLDILAQAAGKPSPQLNAPQPDAAGNAPPWARKKP